MFRYIAFAWNPSVQQQREAAGVLTHALRSKSKTWQAAFGQPGLSIFCSDPESNAAKICPLTRNRGVIVGTLFRRCSGQEAPSRMAALTEAESTHLIRRRGRELIDSYWGSYVGFVCDDSSNRKWIVRSPTGELDCLHTRFQGIDLFFSSLIDCPLLDLLTLSVDWEYVETDLCKPIYESHRTGLREISRVVHGECFDIRSDGRAREHYWEPFSIANAGRIDDRAEAARKLRSTARACIHAWASCHSNILELLSGGLDSSIILGLLPSAPGNPAITCLNARSPYDSGTDERAFARLAAEKAGCALVEYERDPHIKLERTPAVPPTVSPLGDLFLYQVDPVFARVCAETSATAIFSGAGGDELFYQSGIRFVWLDHLLSRGPRPSTFGIAMDVARLEGESVWRILSTTPRESPVSLALKDLGKEHTLIAPEVLANVAQRRLFMHPWFDSAKPVLPGKQWHIMGLAGAIAQDMYRRQDSQFAPIENIAPLMSQPLIELCLQIPTYILCSGRRDRTLAREAFATDVPAPILKRCVKGLTYEVGKAIVQQNISLVREVLLDGVLVARGILDRKKLEASLAGNSTSTSGHATHILMYMATEVWAAGWLRSTQRVAAA